MLHYYRGNASYRGNFKKHHSVFAAEDGHTFLQVHGFEYRKQKGS